MAASPRITVHVSPAQKALIDEETKLKKCSEGEVIRNALTEYFDRKKDIAWQKRTTKKLDAILAALLEEDDE